MSHSKRSIHSNEYQIDETALWENRAKISWTARKYGRSESEIEEIRELFREGFSIPELAKKFKISTSTIYYGVITEEDHEERKEFLEQNYWNIMAQEFFSVVERRQQERIKEVQSWKLEDIGMILSEDLTL